MSKYTPLQKFLAGLPAETHEITLTFARIEKILGDALPPSSHNHRPWWANESEGSHSHARSWLNAGWKVDGVDLSAGWVHFERFTPEPGRGSNSSGRKPAKRERPAPSTVSPIAQSQEPAETQEKVVKSKYRAAPLYFQVHAELVRAAEYRGLTTYQDIAVLMGLTTSGSHMARELGTILGEISEDEIAAGRPMLSAVAVGVGGKPGQGFFALAHDLGRLRPGESDDAFWQREREAVYAAWKRPLPVLKKPG